MSPKWDFAKIVSLAALATTGPFVLYSQRTDENLRGNVNRPEHGHHMQVEGNLPTGDPTTPDQMLKQYGIEDSANGKPVKAVVVEPTPLEKPVEVKKPVAEIERRPTTVPNPNPNPTPKPIPTPPPSSVPAFLGVHYEMEWGSTNGSHVTKVEPGTPASRAGLKAGDVITHADGQQLVSLEDLSRIISGKKAGDKVKLNYVRSGKVSTVIVTLAERDEAFFANNPNGSIRYQLEQDYEITPDGRVWIEESRPVKPDFGTPLLGVLMVNAERRTVVNGVETVVKTEGAIVEDVIDRSAAAEMGLRKGDRIAMINGRHMRTSNDVTTYIASLKPGDAVNLEYVRNGQRLEGSNTVKRREDFDLPDDLESEGIVVDGSMRPGADTDMWDRMHRMMEDAKARANGGASSNETETLIRMEPLSVTEAQALAAKVGQPIRTENDLDLRGLNISPNPNTGLFHLGFELIGRGFTTVEVRDFGGNSLYNEQLRDFQGRYAKEFGVPESAKGSYVLLVQQNGRSFTRKVVME